ncbi:hypothetical protein HYQ45_005619 [Verticillium longisporum]|uniref:Uncharacterized protein n=1 Tax=Verticillium longisporum TaxID=100787 RepID=A0A8I3ART4_VERLO|nr:hypothetical protein HYQ45_005619 [Verticillium longisporum]
MLRRGEALAIGTIARQRRNGTARMEGRRFSISLTRENDSFGSTHLVGRNQPVLDNRGTRGNMSLGAAGNLGVEEEIAGDWFPDLDAFLFALPRWSGCLWFVAIIVPSDTPSLPS